MRVILIVMREILNYMFKFCTLISYLYTARIRKERDFK